MRNKKGFTLVELIAVIGLLSIIMLLVIPAVDNLAINSRKSLRNSKIDTIVIAGEKYGNDSINKYQTCQGSIGSIETNCTVDIGTLIQKGYMEGEENTSTVLDPTTNEPFDGKVLICYDPAKVRVYTEYVDDGNYSCSAMASGRSLNLSSVISTGYIGGAEQYINIISHGNFTSMDCNSSNKNVATCSVIENNSKVRIRYSNSYQIPSTRDFENIILTVTGSYVEDGGVPLEKKINLQVYETSLGLNLSDSHVCMKTGDTQNINITGKNLGEMSVSIAESNHYISGIVDSKTLYLTASNNAGNNKLTVTENNGRKSTTLNTSVYSIEVDGRIPNNVVVGKTATFKINHANVGTITLTAAQDVATGLYPIKFVTSTNEKVTSLTINETQNTDTIKVIGTSIGTSKIKIQGANCGYIEANINVSNLSLETNEEILYVGGKSKDIGIISDSNVLSCSSSNTRIVNCYINGPTLVVEPGSAGGSATITVTNDVGGKDILDVEVLTTNIYAVDENYVEITKVCNSKDTNDKSEFYVMGRNLGEISIQGVNDTNSWFLANVTNAGTQITAEKRNLNDDDYGDEYNIDYTTYDYGYNTGRVPITIREDNGNKTAQVDMYIYDMELNNIPSQVNVGGTKTFNVISYATGPISVATTSTSAVDISVKKVDDTDYDYGPNVKNVYEVTVKGKRVQNDVEIIITGANCGTEVVHLGVIGNTYEIFLERGTYTNRITNNTTRLSCTTVLSSSSCTVTLPTFTPKTGFEIVGYSKTKDSTTREYSGGNTITLNALTSGTTYYANSKDVTKPTCEFIDVMTSLGGSDIVKLRCNDFESGIKDDFILTEDDFIINRPNVAEIEKISTPSHIEDGLEYEITLKGKAFGSFNLTFKANVVSDKFDLKNSQITTSDILSTEYEYVDMWFIGKEERGDVIAVLYDNENLNGDRGTYTLKIYGEGDMIEFTPLTASGGGWRYAPWYSSYRTDITDVIIVDTVTNVGDYAFYQSTNLKNVTISKGATRIGAYAFYQTGMTEVLIPKAIEDIGEYAFTGTNYLNTKIERITFESSSNVKTIGNYAFAYHKATDLKIPAALEVVGEHAFRQADVQTKEVTTLTFDDGSKLKSIGASAFRLLRIESLKIPASVETIGAYAFAQGDYDGVLKELIFEETSNLNTVGNYAFYKNLLSEVSIPSSVISIGNNAFEQGYREIKMSKLKFNSTSILETIGDYAFSGTYLDELELPESLKTIGKRAFGISTNVTDLHIGPNVENIGIDFLVGSKFETITVDDKNTKFTAIEGVLYNKEKTTLIKVPEAYGNNKDVLNIENTVTLIEKNAIGGYMFLDDTSYKVILPNGITELNIEDNFSPNNINSIEIEDNTLYKTIDGVLYNGDESILYVIPSKLDVEKYEILNTCNTLYDRCAYSNLTVKEITVPSSVTSIGFYSLASDPKYSFSTINLNTSEDLMFENNSFLISMTTIDEDTRERIINVSNESLKELLEESYKSSTQAIYTINVK